MALGDRVRGARRACGLSRAELERKAGLTSRTLERVELRGHRPQRDTLQRIAAALETSVEVLEGDLLDQPLRPVLEQLVAKHGPEAVATEAARVAIAWSKKV